MFCCRKNKQRIFNKNAILKGISSAGVNAGNHHQMGLRDMNTMNKYLDAQSTDGACEDSHSIYQEPYRYEGTSRENRHPHRQKLKYPSLLAKIRDAYGEKKRDPTP